MARNPWKQERGCCEKTPVHSAEGENPLLKGKAFRQEKEREGAACMGGSRPEKGPPRWQGGD